MKRLAFIIIACLVAGDVCQGRIVTVDDDDPADFSTIQAAIDDANDGDFVIVKPGRYTGAGNRDVSFRGKAITVRSIDPNNSRVVGATIIEPNGTRDEPHCAFFFGSGEDANSVIAGFTITRGYGLRLSYTFGAAHQGGAIVCRYDTGPTIRNCVIKDNAAAQGGGIHCHYRSKPVIVNCLFINNRARHGSGLESFMARPTIRNCTFVRNYVSWIQGGTAGPPGGAVFSYGDSDNEEHTPTISNCIVRDNYDHLGEPSDVLIRTDARLTYSNIAGGFEGEGNIDLDPCFADPGYWDPNGTVEDANDDFWVDGDYHLKSQGGRWDANEGRWTIDEVTSLCIDAGDPMSPVGQEPFPNGGVVNMGAYGGTTEASKSYFGKPPCETIVAGDINGDCIVDLRDLCIMGLHWCEGE